MGVGVPERQFRAGKNGAGVGKTKVSKVMVVEEDSLPIGLHVDNAQPHEITLAEVALQTVRVPQKRIAHARAQKRG